MGGGRKGGREGGQGERSHNTQHKDTMQKCMRNDGRTSRPSYRVSYPITACEVKSMVLVWFERDSKENSDCWMLNLARERVREPGMSAAARD